MQHVEQTEIENTEINQKTRERETKTEIEIERGSASRLHIGPT